MTTPNDKPTILELTPETFAKEALESAQLVVVDFWGPHCGPCRAIPPLFEDLAPEFAGKARFAKMDIEAYPEFAARFRIASVPALLFFKDGHVVGQRTGIPSKRDLAARIRECLGTA